MDGLEWQETAEGVSTAPDTSHGQASGERGTEREILALQWQPFLMARLGFDRHGSACVLKQMSSARLYQIRSCTVMFRVASILNQNAMINFPLSPTVQFCNMFLLSQP